MHVLLLDIAFENTFSYDLLFRNTRNRLVIEQNRYMCINATRCIVRNFDYRILFQYILYIKIL